MLNQIAYKYKMPLKFALQVSTKRDLACTTTTTRTAQKKCREEALRIIAYYLTRRNEGKIKNSNT